MCPRGTRGAYRNEERVELPKDLQKELVEKASTRFGTLEKLAKKLELPKSSIHYYRIGRLTLPVSVMEALLKLAGDPELEERVRDASVAKDRTWANAYAAGIHREMCRERVNLPTRQQLEEDDELRRKAAAIISYVMAEGSIWIRHNKFDAGMVNITFADHETDLYDHFRSLCRDVFDYDIGPPQEPGNKARAIRGFICSRFVAEWLIDNGVPVGEKSATNMRLPSWAMKCKDIRTRVAALQPWCDGEGTVAGGDVAIGFSISQSKHTTLTDDDISYGHANQKYGYISKSALCDIQLEGHSVLEACDTKFRSAVIDDLKRLCNALGMNPKTDISRLVMKSDGFWSCIWSLRFNKADACRLICLGAITQSAKRARFG